MDLNISLLNASPNTDFNPLYNSVGNPATVTGTTGIVDSSGLLGSPSVPQVGQVLISNLNDVTSASGLHLLAHGDSACVIGSTLIYTITLASTTRSPYVIDLGDTLTLQLNGTSCSFTYVKGWHNNTAQIQFKAPTEPGSYSLTWTTTSSINTNTASSYLTVLSTQSGYYLKALKAEPIGTRDVTILTVTAKNYMDGSVYSEFLANDTLKTFTTNVISPLVGGVQTITLPVTATSQVIPAWFSFALAATDANFSKISADLSFVDAEGVTQWAMPLTLPGTPQIDSSFPFPNWNDAYTLLLGLMNEVGLQNGSFVVTFTNQTVTPITLVHFTVQTAKPYPVDPVSFTDQNGAKVVSLFPLVWVNGSTNIITWSDSEN